MLFSNRRHRLKAYLKLLMHRLLISNKILLVMKYNLNFNTLKKPRNTDDDKGRDSMVLYMHGNFSLIAHLGD